MRVLPLLALTAALSLQGQEHEPAAATKAKPKAKPEAHAAAPAGQVATPAAHGPAPSADTPDSPSAALTELATGNARFVAGKRVRTLDTGHDVAMRAALVGGQSPFAIVITCSDSRVPDALVFDQEAGRLFTIREAGNAPDLQGIASAEYAADHLGSKLIVVMGHTSCGAVKAIREANGKPLPGNLWALQAGMSGLLESTPHDPNEEAKAHLSRLEEANAKRQAQAILDRSSLLHEKVAAEQLWVVPALYHLDTGKVQFFKPLSLAPAASAHH
ncbi:carbonic anhydrase [Geothrix sp. PMB-07]|uniref:carbonic anhydrase n=1 Tax=Geothrix sp. PMB-07 TaxID=3068640 RepID=UPI002740B9D0|nr:carbonic anhydrase [Geothrix sp. PMB-07]WLT30536.1 carbonic anhydrase [Geothrix sp. PMB-07]